MESVMFRLDTRGNELKITGNPIPVRVVGVDKTMYYAVRYKGALDSDGSSHHGGCVFSYTNDRVRQNLGVEKEALVQAISYSLNLHDVTIEELAEIRKQDYDDWIAAHPGEVSYE